jgi:hypothetical protein
LLCSPTTLQMNRWRQGESREEDTLDANETKSHCKSAHLDALGARMTQDDSDMQRDT